MAMVNGVRAFSICASRTPTSKNTNIFRFSYNVRTRCFTNDASSPKSTRKIVLYSKKECCLCDALKEKLNVAFMLGGTPHSLSDVQLEVRDITTNPKWEEAYKYQIPVLAKLLPDGSEEKMPRMSPRATAEQVHDKLAQWLLK